VHQSLKRCRGICQTEGHDKELEMSMVSVKGGLGDVGIVHPDLMEDAAQV
jgi:hypothetical protein